MREGFQDSILRLLRFQRAPEKATAIFRTLKHNADLLPTVQQQLEMVLDAYGKFEPVVYDCQGIRDDGSDIAIRFDPKDQNPELICFQVKSFQDLSKSTYLQELKAQRDDSFRKVRGLRFYFIMLCTDAKEHKNRIRSIVSEFRDAAMTRVIEPAYSYTFIHFAKTRIDSFVTRMMEGGDYVLRTATESLDVASPSAKALALFMVVRWALAGQTRFSLDQLIREPILRAIYDELRGKQITLLEQSGFERIDEHELADASDWLQYSGSDIQLEFNDQLAADVELLSDVVEANSSSEDIILRNDQLLALTAVITDAKVRYEYNQEQLISYMFDLMGVRD